MTTGTLITGWIALLATLPLLAATDAWTSLGPDGGTAAAIAVDPRDSATLYAVTTAGVIKTTDGAATWTAANAGMPTSGVHSVVIDSQNHNTLYAATTVGVFKSTDAGSTWQAANSGLAGFLLVGTTDVPALAIDPHDSTLYRGACCLAGIFRSVDGGANWSYVGGNPPQQYSRTTLLIVDPNTPGTVYSVQPPNGPAGTLLKTTNAGDTWTGLSLPCCANALAIDPHNSSTLYAVNCCVLYKSTDGGVTWNASIEGLPITGAQGAYTALVIDPAATQTLYVSAYGGIYQSKDGAATWHKLDSAPSRGIQTVTLAGSVLYAGTSDGVMRSADGGATWNAANTGLRAQLITTLKLDPLNPATLYAVTFDTIFKSTDRGMSWALANAGLPPNQIEGLAIDTKNSGTIYAGVSGGGSQTGGVFKSADGGATWTRSAVPKGGGVEGFAADPQNSNRIYAWNSQGAYLTTDGASTWTNLGNSSPVRALVVDPHDSNTLFGISNTQEHLSVVKSVDGGVTWSDAGAGLPSYSITALSIHPQDDHTLYAWSSQYDSNGPQLFKSTDGGASWSPAATGLEGNSTVGFTIDPNNPARLYAATMGFNSASVPVNGIWTTVDAGAHWTPFAAHLPDILNVDGLLTDGSLLYALTSSGVYVVAL